MPDLPKQPLQSHAHQQPGAQSLDVPAGCAERPPAWGSLVSKDKAGTWAGEQALAHCVWVCLPGSCLCLISHLGRSVFLRLPCSVLCDLTRPTTHQVIEHEFMLMEHWKNSEKLIFSDILKKLDNKYPRKKAQIMVLWGGLSLSEGHNTEHPGVPSMETASWESHIRPHLVKQWEDNGTRNPTAKPGC